MVGKLPTLLYINKGTVRRHIFLRYYSFKFRGTHFPRRRAAPPGHTEPALGLLPSGPFPLLLAQLWREEPEPRAEAVGASSTGDQHQRDTGLQGAKDQRAEGLMCGLRVWEAGGSLMATCCLREGTLSTIG